MPLTQRDEFDNIILLCPTCHTTIDKNPQLFPKETIRKWKREHQERIENLFITPKFDSREDARKYVLPLLAENKAIFEAFGPFSENAAKDHMATELEWNVIKANMRENIEQIEKHQPNEELMRHFNRGYISLLTGMNIFIKSIKYEVREEELRVTQLLEKLCGYNSPLAALSSDDYDSVIDGTFFLLEEVKDKGVEGCLTEIGLLVNRVLLQKKEGLESCMSLLYGIMEEYAEVMVKHFGPQLIEMLKRYSDDFDYQELKVRVPNVYFILRNIARWMEPMYSGERSIEYWMNAPAVNRFNIG